MSPFPLPVLLDRTALASLAAERGDLDRAKTLLEPLLSRSRLHVRELASLCLAQINVHLAEGDHREAKHWVDMLRQSIPDHPSLALSDAQLQGPRSRWGP